MKHTERLSVTYHGLTVGTLTMTPDRMRCATGYNGETIRIPRKRGQEIIRSVAEACREILAEGWKSYL